MNQYHYKTTSSQPNCLSQNIVPGPDKTLKENPKSNHSQTSNEYTVIIFSFLFQNHIASNTFIKTLKNL